jgi:hypothetical protein
MNSEQINQILRRNTHTKKYFLGVYSADNLPHTIAKYPSCFVANTDPHWEMGEHWICIWMQSPTKAEYFCSLGEAPPPTFQAFLTKFKYIQTNEGKQIQSPGENTCGHYCIYFIVCRATGQSFNTVINTLWKTRAMADMLVKYFVRHLMMS